MALGQNLAGVARVSYEAVGLAEFKNDNAQAEASYRDTARSMTDEAIRLDLAQDNLRRSLQKGPAAYRAQARAELQVRNAERALRGETDALTRSQDRNRRGIGGLRSSVVGLAAAYIGTTGVISLVRSSVNAAREEELVLGQTKVALESVGLSYDSYGAKLEATIAKVQQLGFDDEDLAKSFQLLARSADSPQQALDELGLAAGVARGRYIDLEQATNIVNKANLGMSGALRRVGLDVAKNATSTQLLTALTQAYGKSAEEASDSGVAAADRFSVAIEETQESIGAGLAPAVTDLSERITKWLSIAENQERLQRAVTDAVETGETAVRGLAAGLQVVKTVAEPVVDALGGVENTVKAITLAWVAFKAKAVLGFAGTAAASRAAAASMVRDATVAGRAWDVATRPRVMTVATVGGGGGPGAPTPTGTGRGFLGQIGRGVAVYGPLAAYSVAALRLTRDTSGDPRSAGTVPRGMRHAGMTIFWRPDRRAFTYGLTDEVVELDVLVAAGLAKPPRDPIGIRGDRDRPNMGRPVESPGGGSGGAPARRRRTMSDILLDQARASSTPGTSDDLRLHREAATLLQRQIDNLERRKNLTVKQKDELRRLYGELASEQAAIDSIIDDGEAKLAAQREAAETKREERRQREAARMEKILDSATRASERRADLLAGTGGSRQNMRRQALAGVGETVAGLKKKGDKDGKGLTAAEVHAMQFGFLQTLTGEIAQWGSNFTSDGGSGQLETNSHVQTQIQQQTLAAMHRLIEGGWHPGAQLASAELSAAGWGVGF